MLDEPFDEDALREAYIKAKVKKSRKQFKRKPKKI